MNYFRLSDYKYCITNKQTKNDMHVEFDIKSKQYNYTSQRKNHNNRPKEYKALKILRMSNLGMV